MKRPNVKYFLWRATGRPLCEMTASTQLARSSKIINIARTRERIRLGPNTLIRGELLVFPQGGDIAVGEWCYVGENTRIWSAASIHIGNRVLISHGVNLFDSLTHPLDAAERHRQTREIFLRGHPLDIDLGARPVVIRDDAWLGAGCFVLAGVTIGARSIVAAGAVVTKDVPDGVIVAGNPASVLRPVAQQSDPQAGRT